MKSCGGRDRFGRVTTSGDVTGGETAAEAEFDDDVAEEEDAAGVEPTVGAAGVEPAFLALACFSFFSLRSLLYFVMAFRVACFG